MQNDVGRVYALTLFKMTNKLVQSGNADATPVLQHVYQILRQFANLLQIQAFATAQKEEQPRQPLDKTETLDKTEKSDALPTTLAKKMHKFLTSPTIAVQEKQKVVAIILNQLVASQGIPLPLSDKLQSAFLQLLFSFFKVVAKNNRILAIADICLAYQKIIDKKLQEIRVHVRSAKQLDASQEIALKKVVGNFFDQEIVLENSITTGILGGFSLQFNQYSFDMTLDQTINALSHKLLQSSQK